MARTLRLHVPNISCMHCVHTIEKALSNIEGVLFVEARVDTKEVEVTFDEPATEALIRQRLQEIGYPAT